MEPVKPRRTVPWDRKVRRTKTRTRRFEGVRTRTLMREYSVTRHGTWTMARKGVRKGTAIQANKPNTRIVTFKIT